MDEVIINTPVADPAPIRIPPGIRRVIRTSGGIAVLAVALTGLLHGIKAGTAQAMYHEAKFGGIKDDTDAILVRCEKARQLYPQNYYFPMWAGEKAYSAALGCGNKEESDRLFAEASKWCDAGIDLNSYRPRVRILKTRLTERNSVADAVKYWEDFMKWQFWTPYNHSLMVELCSKSGDIEKAYASLRLLKDTTFQEAAAKQFEDAWRKEVALTKPANKPRKQTRP